MVVINSFLEKNLQIISKYNPELANKILNHADLQANYEINEAKSGDNILYKNSIAVDDEIDPIWAAVETCSGIQHNCKRSITFLCGIGLGYTLKEFTRRLKGNIILHEPDLDFLRIALECVDFSDELAKKTVIITNTEVEIQEAYNKLFFKGYNLNFVASKYYQSNEITKFNEIKKEVTNLHSIFEQNYNNLWLKNQAWTALLFNNIPRIADNQDFHVLKDSFKNKTAVIISAGPSLDKNIEELKHYRDKLVIFCVGVAFKAAVRHGIIPDFVMAIDNFKEIIDIPEVKDVNLILAATSYSELFEVSPRRFFNYYNKTMPVCKWIAGVMGIKDLNYYETAGTVSINCFYAAKLMGCDKIIFIGQDLAYTDNKCYSQGSAYAEFKVNQESQKELSGHEKFLNTNLIQVKGLNGLMLFTRPDYYLFILYFQKIAREYASQLKLINATEGGVYLEGFDHITLKEALENYTDEIIDVESCLSKFELTENELAIRKKRIIKEFNLVSQNDKELKNFIFSGVKEGFMPYYNPDLDKNYPHEQRKTKMIIEYKKYRREDLTSEENLFIQKLREKWASEKQPLKEKIEELFNNNPKRFSENLKILKDTYLKMRKLIDLNPFLKYSLFCQILNVDNLLVDFDNKDEELIEMSHSLNFLFLFFYTHWSIYNEEIENIVSKLEIKQ